jgi:protein translocase SecG subunit
MVGAVLYKHFVMGSGFPFCPWRGIIACDMEIVRTILPYVQIILSILLVAAILLQQRGSSLGGAFGGDNFSATYHKRRGAELFLHRFSIVIAILFVATTFVSLAL